VKPPSRINDYGLLSDCQGSALVSREGSIDWACTPRFDSPSMFARRLDPAAGHWRIGPTREASVSRAYLQLGNFPQAFTHIGLVNAAWDLDRARSG
jgi:GH15 family glucan-1,4-alpha-glucosidase